MEIVSNVDVDYTSPRVIEELTSMFTRDYEHFTEQFDELWSAKKQKKEHKLIRVYVGPSSDTGPMSHIGMFNDATRELRLVERGWTIEQLDSATIRQNLAEWTFFKSSRGLATSFNCAFYTLSRYSQLFPQPMGIHRLQESDQTARISSGISSGEQIAVSRVQRRQVGVSFSLRPVLLAFL